MRNPTFLTSLAGARHLALQLDAATPGGIREPEPARFPWGGLFVIAAVAAGVVSLVVQ